MQRLEVSGAVQPRCQMITGILLKLRKTNNFTSPRMSQNGPRRQSCCNRVIYSLLLRAYGTTHFTMAIPEMDKFGIKKVK